MVSRVNDSDQLLFSTLNEAFLFCKNDLAE
jgi:hypothetical protein